MSVRFVGELRRGFTSHPVGANVHCSDRPTTITASQRFTRDRAAVSRDLSEAVLELYRLRCNNADVVELQHDLVAAWEMRVDALSTELNELSGAPDLISLFSSSSLCPKTPHIVAPTHHCSLVLHQVGDEAVHPVVAASPARGQGSHSSSLRLLPDNSPVMANVSSEVLMNGRGHRDDGVGGSSALLSSAMANCSNTRQPRHSSSNKRVHGAAAVSFMSSSTLIDDADSGLPNPASFRIQERESNPQHKQHDPSSSPPPSRLRRYNSSLMSVVDADLRMLGIFRPIPLVRQLPLSVVRKLKAIVVRTKQALQERRAQQRYERALRMHLARDFFAVLKLYHTASLFCQTWSLRNGIRHWRSNASAMILRRQRGLACLRRVRRRVVLSRVLQAWTLCVRVRSILTSHLRLQADYEQQERQLQFLSHEPLEATISRDEQLRQLARQTQDGAERSCAMSMWREPYHRHDEQTHSYDRSDTETTRTPTTTALPTSGVEGTVHHCDRRSKSPSPSSPHTTSTMSVVPGSSSVETSPSHTDKGADDTQHQKYDVLFVDAQQGSVSTTLGGDGYAGFVVPRIVESMLHDAVVDLVEWRLPMIHMLTQWRSYTKQRRAKQRRNEQGTLHRCCHLQRSVLRDWRVMRQVAVATRHRQGVLMKKLMLSWKHFACSRAMQVRQKAEFIGGVDARCRRRLFAKWKRLIVMDEVVRMERDADDVDRMATRLRPVAHLALNWWFSIHWTHQQFEQQQQSQSDGGGGTAIPDNNSGSLRHAVLQHERYQQLLWSTRESLPPPPHTTLVPPPAALLTSLITTQPELHRFLPADTQWLVARTNVVTCFMRWKVYVAARKRLIEALQSFKQRFFVDRDRQGGGGSPGGGLLSPLCRDVLRVLDDAVGEVSIVAACRALLSSSKRQPPQQQPDGTLTGQRAVVRDNIVRQLMPMLYNASTQSPEEDNNDDVALPTTAVVDTKQRGNGGARTAAQKQQQQQQRRVSAAAYAAMAVELDDLPQNAVLTFNPRLVSALGSKKHFTALVRHWRNTQEELCAGVTAAASMDVSGAGGDGPTAANTAASGGGRLMSEESDEDDDDADAMNRTAANNASCDVVEDGAIDDVWCVSRGQLLMRRRAREVKAIGALQCRFAAARYSLLAASPSDQGRHTMDTTPGQTLLGFIPAGMSINITKLFSKKKRGGRRRRRSASPKRKPQQEQDTQPPSTSPPPSLPQFTSPSAVPVVDIAAAMASISQRRGPSSARTPATTEPPPMNNEARSNVNHTSHHNSVSVVGGNSFRGGGSSTSGMNNNSNNNSHHSISSRNAIPSFSNEEVVAVSTLGRTATHVPLSLPSAAALDVPGGGDGGVDDDGGVEDQTTTISDPVLAATAATAATTVTPGTDSSRRVDDVTQPNSGNSDDAEKTTVDEPIAADAAATAEDFDLVDRAARLAINEAFSSRTTEVRIDNDRDDGVDDEEAPHVADVVADACTTTTLVVPSTACDDVTVEPWASSFCCAADEDNKLDVGDGPQSLHHTSSPPHHHPSMDDQHSEQMVSQQSMATENVVVSPLPSSPAVQPLSNDPAIRSDGITPSTTTGPLILIDDDEELLYVDHSIPVSSRRDDSDIGKSSNDDPSSAFTHQHRSTKQHLASYQIGNPLTSLSLGVQHYAWDRSRARHPPNPNVASAIDVTVNNTSHYSDGGEKRSSSGQQRIALAGSAGSAVDESQHLGQQRRSASVSEIYSKNGKNATTTTTKNAMTKSSTVLGRPASSLVRLETTTTTTTRTTTAGTLYGAKMIADALPVAGFPAQALRHRRKK